MQRLALLLLLCLALPAAAAEVCRFRALDAENPFPRWLASQEVTCVPADAPLEFPAGLWNVFTRADGAVSAAPLVVEGGATRGWSEPVLGPGATVAPLLPAERTGVIYAPRRGSAFPVDGPRVTVPADEPLWLLVLDRSTPVAVLPIAPIPPHAERAVDARGGGPAAIIGWLQVPEADRSALQAATGVSSPTVHGGPRTADPLPPPLMLHGAFYRIADVPAGNAELRVEGRGWVPDRVAVKVQPGVTVAAAPLLVRAAGTLVVHWNTDEDLAALDRSIGACQEPDGAQPQLIIAVSKCSPPRGSGPRHEVGDCSPMREEKPGNVFGSLTFDNVVPGLYRAEMRYGKLPPVIATASVMPLRVADLRLFASYFALHGRVTRGGEPLGEDVAIRFPGGVGFAPASSDEYHAVFREPYYESDVPFQVAACDGEPKATVLSDRPIGPRSPFDIDIPVNELTIHVTDTFTREVLPGSTVKLEAMSMRGTRVVYTAAGATDGEGNLVWTGLPARKLHITVSHGGYEKRVLEPFSLDSRAAQSVDVQLVPLRGTYGRIVSDRPFDSGAVLWFSPAGAETERADLAEDGTFAYLNQHTPDETMAVVSASHPLWVLHAPAVERRESISLQFPAGPTATFDVGIAASVRPGETRYIGVSIGGLRVPQPVLAQHQTLRRDPPLIRGSGPQHFRDLLATGPIDVLYGPTLEEVAPRVRAMDLFALPQFAAAPRERLQPGSTHVVFAPGR